MTQRTVTASQEDYLEAIYSITSEKSVARVKEIAEHLGVHKSTVTAALHQLADRGLVNYAPYEAATLTSQGQRIGRAVLRRHETLTGFLVDVLGVDAKTAAETACKMEHVVPAGVIERFARFAEYFDECPKAKAVWQAGLGYSCGDEDRLKDCVLCARRASQRDRRGNSEH